MTLVGYSVPETLVDDRNRVAKSKTLAVTGPNDYEGVVVSDAVTGVFRLGPLPIGEYTVTYGDRSAVVPVLPMAADVQNAYDLAGGAGTAGAVTAETAARIAADAAETSARSAADIAESTARAAADAAELAARVAADATDDTDDAAEVTARQAAVTAEATARAAADVAEAALRASLDAREAANNAAQATAIGDETAARAAAITAEAAARVAADNALQGTLTANTTALGLRQITVEHGSVAATARPSSTLPVKWLGTVFPTNAVTNDEYTDRASDMLYRWSGAAWLAVGRNAYRPLSQSFPALPLVPISRGTLLLDNGASHRARSAIAEQVYRDPLGGRWWILYTAIDAAGVTTPGWIWAPDDGISDAVPTTGWTDVGAFLGVSGDAPHYVRDGSTHYVFTATSGVGQTIKLYKSTTSQTSGYTLVGTMISPGAAGKFDENSCREPYVWRLPDGRWRCLYMGFDGTVTHEQIGMATTSGTSIESGWTKDNSGDPIIANGAAGTFDSNIVADPMHFEYGGVAYIYYCAGGDFSLSGAIPNHGHCTLALVTTTDWVTFTKRGVQLYPPAWPDPSAMDAWRGGMHIGRNGRIYWVRGGTHTRNAAGAGQLVQTYLDVFDGQSLVGGPRGNPWQRVEGEATTDTRLSYTGTWTTLAGHNELSGTGSRFADVAASQVTFRFSGRAVRWGTALRDSQGIAQVYLDGVLVATVDLYHADTTGFSPVAGYENLNLAPGYHTLQIVVTGTKNAAASGAFVNVAYFDYIPALVGG